MFIVKRMPEFDDWLAGIKGGLTARRSQVRLRKATLGNLGDVKPVGHGVWEMREFFGPGWRMDDVRRGTALIVMLGGGDKSMQSVDIARPVALAATLED